MKVAKIITNIAEHFSREDYPTTKKSWRCQRSDVPKHDEKQSIIQKVLVFMCIVTMSFPSYADDINVFKEYAHRADSAYARNNIKLCLQINEDLIVHFNANRQKFVKNDVICKIAFDAISSNSLLDKSKNDKEICELLISGLSLIDNNPNWVKGYVNKEHITDCFINLIGSLAQIGDTIQACNYNQKMISFAEQYYKSEMPNVLFKACSMYSLLHKFDEEYPLYQRLYKIFDDLDKFQQFKVVKSLITLEFEKDNYQVVVELSHKHEKLIAKSKDESKATVLDLIGLGHLRFVKYLENRYKDTNTTIIDQSYNSACSWALRNKVPAFPFICIEYAYWLYSINELVPKALLQCECYLDYLENCNQETLFDSKYRRVEDAENALISILVRRIITSSTPTDLNEIIKKYPKVISEIRNNPNSRYYEDFNQSIKLAKEKCYGK